MASFSRICSQQQSTFSNKSVSVYSELWWRIENGSRYKEKRKNKKSNRVCRKNEESIGGSWGSINKSTRENEVTDKQEKKRSWRMEEEE